MAQVDTNPQKIEEILTRGVHTLYTKEDLKKKLLSGKQLHLKLGTDVTGAFLTLGHAVIHRKIRDFQDLGHKITLIIGNFTTLVGDHSDKVDMRAEANAKEIKKNEATYKEQFFKTVHKESTEIRHNSEWLKDLNFNDVINLAKQFTVQQMLDREAFLLRYKNHKPIGLDEFLYPLMQGYDSVVLKCDVEFGGTDQTFNLLAGRKLMPVFGLEPQCAVVMKLLTGNDGRPMGKSLQNFIPIMDNPHDMYGKVMSIVDDIIIEYFELVTRVPMDEIHAMDQEMKAGANPMQFKKRLAHEIVSFYHSKELADRASQEFENTVQRGEVPEDIPSKVINARSFVSSPTILQLTKETGLAPSGKEARRIIEQGGVTLNGKAIKDPNHIINIKGGEILKVGKRKFVKLILS